MRPLLHDADCRLAYVKVVDICFSEKINTFASAHISEGQFREVGYCASSQQTRVNCVHATPSYFDTNVPQVYCERVISKFHNHTEQPSLMLAGSEFQSLGRAIVKEDEYEEVRWDGISLMLAGNEFQSLGRAIVKEDEYEEVRWDDVSLGELHRSQGGVEAFKGTTVDRRMYSSYFGQMAP
ncbi:hypothetical protein ANN_22752 [Periplaneta americana]|uniref:Uncharacterized protein n=1 Tax=Periplaneta americana TaxID=6978 RepID=A0ABQ8SJ80_PERAM|nr:hypothetical protein ANN_22752 [Periplaneta americana]